MKMKPCKVKNKNLEEKIKTLEQNHKTEKESFENKHQQEQFTELNKIREEERYRQKR